MAALTFYWKDAVPTGATLHRSLQDGGVAPTTATTGTGWISGQNVTGQSCIQNGGSEIARTDGQWSATLRPSTGPSQTTGDCWRSENAYSGGFSNTDWTFTFGIRSVTAASTGRLKLAVRVWRSTNQNGTGAVELTSGRVVSAATSANLSTSADTTVTCTWSSPGTPSLTAEYLFVNVGIEITSAGGGNTQDVDFRVGSAYTLVTPEFTPSVALTGVAGTGAAGSVGVTYAKALTGVSATGAVGTLIPPYGQAVVSWAEVEGTDGGVAIDGVSATGSAGSLTPVFALALTGVAATSAIGSPAVGIGLSGVAATGSAGIPAIGIPQTGVSATGAAGSVGVSASVALTGVSATGSAGTVSLALELTGVEGTGSAGSVTANASIALSGVSATGAAGSVTANASFALTGFSATGSQGTVSPQTDVEDVEVALSGVEATTESGTVTPDASYALTGVSATGSAGFLAVVVSRALSGHESTASAGSVSPTLSTEVALSGVDATASVGAVSASAQIVLEGVSATGDVGSVLVGGQIDLELEGIASAEAFGTLSTALGAKPGFTASANWPDDAVFRDLWIQPYGIRSAEAFGVVTVELEQPVRGIESRQSVGKSGLSVSLRTWSIGTSDVVGRIAPQLEIAGFSIETRAEVSRAFAVLGPRHRRQREAEFWMLRR